MHLTHRLHFSEFGEDQSNCFRDAPIRILLDVVVADWLAPSVRSNWIGSQRCW